VSQLIRIVGLFCLVIAVITSVLAKYYMVLSRDSKFVTPKYVIHFIPKRNLLVEDCNVNMGLRFAVFTV
jgi:hypothetical protein